MSSNRFSQQEIRTIVEAMYALEQAAKGLRAGRFKWDKYPQAAKPAEIRKIRQSLKYSLKNFASLLGVSPVTAKAWESGKISPDGPATKLLRALRERPQLASFFEKI
jgi:DNA-binding transcriptional regulator YiaG